MRRSFLRSIAAAGLLLTLAAAHQRAGAKEPTIDDRFRDAGSNRSETELPLLNPQQSKLAHENPDAVNLSGPGYLGVTFADNNGNAVVRTVATGSPAEQAGLQPRDVIETLQGISIGSPQEVVDIIAKMRPGTMLDIGVSRRVIVRAQAPLAMLPAATSHSASYPPESTSNSLSASSVREDELIPVPVSATRKTPAAIQPSPRKTTQGSYGTASGQSRNGYKNNGQTNDNRRLGMGRRR